MTRLVDVSAQIIKLIGLYRHYSVFLSLFLSEREKSFDHHRVYGFETKAKIIVQLKISSLAN